MGVLDQPMRKVAKSVVRKFGKQGTIEYVATGGYNPSTGVASQSSAKTAVVRGALTEYAEREIDGTVVKRGDLKWSVHALDVDEPNVNDVVDFGEETTDGNRIRYTIIGVKRVHSGDESALHILQLRR